MKDRDYAYIISLAAGGILAAGLIFYFTVGKEFIEIPPCFIYRTTGLWCPACGGTRAVLALLKGRLVKSFLYHRSCRTALRYMQAMFWRRRENVCAAAGTESQ